MRDYRALLASERFYDAEAMAIEASRGHPPADRILQNREEVIALCELIEAYGVRSYLEIGVWTGRLVTALDRLFRFDRVAVCDHRWAETLGHDIDVPNGAACCWCDSDSARFLSWREALGHIDLVVIDGNHNHHAVARDIAINRRFSHRFLALHDITGARRTTTGVAKAWRDIEGGYTLEIVRPHAELGLADSTMGIGIWSAAHPGAVEGLSFADSWKKRR